jgi:beta-lactamase regulating signal transducer with metallopeptidase domain
VNASFIDHLWQSTLFVACAWLLARTLRKDGAHLRYWIWFAASVKFLIPVSLLTFFGSYLGTHALPGQPALPLLHVVEQVAAPLFTPAAHRFAGAPVDSAGWAILAWIILVWATGSAALMVRWWMQWRRAHAYVRSAIPEGLVESVPVMRSARLREPGVVGILRPAILLPDGIRDRLTPEQLQAILAHEIGHVRRRDNLTGTIHKLVETVFWFVPWVWWIGTRLIEERERACDERVLRLGHAPQAYAQGILEVCHSCLKSDLSYMAGVSGADLTTRLEEIMKNKLSIRLSRGKQLLLAVSATVALGVPVLLGLTTSPEARAESAKAPAIEMRQGKRVKLDFDNVEVRSLLQALAKAADVNILVSDKVGGTVTVHLAEMPWEQALITVLNSQGLAKREQNGIILVEPAS